MPPSMAWAGILQSLLDKAARGFLADIDSWSFWKFAAVLALPIMPKINNKEDENLGAKLEEVDPWSERCSKLRDVLKYLGQLYFKLGMLLLFTYIIARKDPGTPWREPLYTDCFGSVRYSNSFKHPYLAQDLTDLWGKRWDIMTAATLKPISYDIILEGRLVRPSTRDEKKSRAEWVRPVATVFIFLLSGAFHIVFFWPLMILERVVKSATEPFFKKRKQEEATPLVPAIISFPLRAIITNVFTLALAGLLFCPPIHRSNIQYSADAFQNALLGRFISDQ